MDLQKPCLSNICICVTNVEDTIHISANKVGFINEYSCSQMKKEAGIDEDEVKFYLKQKNICVFKQNQREDSCVYLQNDVKNVNHVDIKQEPNDVEEFKITIEDHSLSDTYFNVRNIVHSFSNDLSCAKECRFQVKSEVGFDDDHRECNLKQEVVKCDSEQIDEDLDNHMNLHIDTENDNKDRIRAGDGLIRIGEDCGKAFIHCQRNNNDENETQDGKHIQNPSKGLDDERGDLFHCNLCKYKCRKRLYLKEHINAKHNENAQWFCCNCCDYKTKRKRSLVVHFRTVHDENPQTYQCLYCEFKTKRKGNLKQHFERMHEERSELHECGLCGVKCNTKSTLRAHVDTEHNLGNTGEYQCQFCEYKTRQRACLKQHFKQKHHKKPTMYPCHLCEMKYTSEAALKDHIHTKHGLPNTKEYRCQFCGCKYLSIRCLRRHITSKHTESGKWYHRSSWESKSQHGLPNTKDYRCQFCGRKYLSISSLKRHITSKHTESGKYQSVSQLRTKHNKNSEEASQHRSNSSDSKTTLRQQQDKITHGAYSKLYQCEFCDYEFKRKHDLKRHIGRKHNENAKCSNYSTKDEYLDYLADYLRAEHDDDEERYQCEFCTYRSKHEYYFKKHIKTHHAKNIEWYQCMSCGYYGDCLQDLTEHFKQKQECQHYNNPKTKCKHSLLKHLEIESDPQSVIFKCQFCEYKKKYKQYFNKHNQKK